MKPAPEAPKDCPRREELGDRRDAFLEPCCDCECLGDVERVLERLWSNDKDGSRSGADAPPCREQQEAVKPST